MATEPSRFGRLLKGYLFFAGKTVTQLALAIGVSPNKLSAAIHGKYHLKRDHVDLIVAELQLTREDSAEFLKAWQSVSERPLPRFSEAQITQLRALVAGFEPGWLATEHVHPYLWAHKVPDLEPEPPGWGPPDLERLKRSLGL